VRLLDLMQSLTGNYWDAVILIQVLIHLRGWRNTERYAVRLLGRDQRLCDRSRAVHHQKIGHASTKAFAKPAITRYVYAQLE